MCPQAYMVPKYPSLNRVNNVRICDSFPSEKAGIYDVISQNEAAIYLKVYTFYSFMPMISCTNFGISPTILSVLSEVWAKKPPSP